MENANLKQQEVNSNKPNRKDFEDAYEYQKAHLNWRYATDIEYRKSVKSYVYNDTYTIYRIINSVNDMVYVGSTKQKLNNRFNSHKQKAFRDNSNSEFHQFVRSVSTFDNFYDIFKIEALETGIESKEDAWKLEGQIIRELGDKCYNQLENSGKHIKYNRKCHYNDFYTVYKISNIFDDKIYVGVTRAKLNVTLIKHRNFAFNQKTNTQFHRFIRSISTKENFYTHFQITALESNIPDADMASEAKAYWLQKLHDDGVQLLNEQYIMKF